jgi:hypothetical protein
MLRLLRKVCGVIALVWVSGWLLLLVNFFVNRKVAVEILWVLYFYNFVGIPGSIIWSVLTVITVLRRARVERAATVTSWWPPSPIPTSGVMRLETPAPVSEAKPAESAGGKGKPRT